MRIRVENKDKLLTEQEVSALTGMPIEELRVLARRYRLGTQLPDAVKGETVFGSDDLDHLFLAMVAWCG